MLGLVARFALGWRKGWAVSAMMRIILLAVGVLATVAGLVYVYTAPFAYQRAIGIRVGGELTPAPADWTTVNQPGLAYLKLAGFPPFVIKIVYSADEGGIITATRPDNGYWAARVRGRPDGWIRIGDATYALAGLEITGDARIPFLESYGGKNGMDMGYDFAGEVIPGSNEPLHTWEVFYWTARARAAE